MNFDAFRKNVQTFGSDPKKWPGCENPSFSLALSGNEAALWTEERRLDDRLNLFSPPFNPGLSERLFAAIVNEQNRRLFFVFLRYSAAVSLLLMICGFYIGWQNAEMNYANTQSYFNDMFDYTLNTTEL